MILPISLTQPHLHTRFDCGMGEGIIRSDMPVMVNAWNTLNIYRDGRNAWMQLNQGQQIFGHSRLHAACGKSAQGRRDAVDSINPGKAIQTDIGSGSVGDG